MPQVSYPASEKQLDYIVSLMRDKEGAEDYTDDYLAVSNSKEASDLINKLRALPYRPRAQGVTKDGMYKDPETETIYKVQRNKAQGDGSRLYAKKLEIDEVDGKTKLRFVYIQGLLKEIKPEWRMTLEQAQAFGELYGVCVRCGRDLTREESIARALGPICAGYFDD